MGDFIVVGIAFSKTVRAREKNDFCYILDSSIIVSTILDALLLWGVN